MQYLHLIILLLLASSLCAQQVPPNVHPGSFVFQFNIGALWPTGLGDDPYGSGRTGVTSILQLQRRVPLGQRLALRAGIGVSIRVLRQESNAGEERCRSLGSLCAGAPNALNVNVSPSYLTLPLDLELRFGPGAEKLYAVVNHTLNINLGGSVSGTELFDDNDGNEISRYAGEVELRRTFSQIGFGLGVRSALDARRPSYIELGPVWSLGEVIRNRENADGTFSTHYARTAGFFALEVRCGFHF